MKDVILWTGAGQIGLAIARRVGYGKKIVVGDKNIDNAKNMQDNYTSAIIYEDNSGYFRVLVGIAYMEENKVKLEAFFTNLGIEYYIKDVKMNEEFTDMLRNYETVIIKSEEREVIENINAAMLELFLTYLN